MTRVAAWMHAMFAFLTGHSPRAYNDIHRIANDLAIERNVNASRRRQRLNERAMEPINELLVAIDRHRRAGDGRNR